MHQKLSIANIPTPRIIYHAHNDNLGLHDIHSENDLPVPTRICLSEEDFQLEIGPREFPRIEGGISAWYNVAS